MSAPQIEMLPTHGNDGWVLVNYELDEYTSTGYFLYTRRLSNGEFEDREVERHQPCASSHRGWRRDDSYQD